MFQVYKGSLIVVARSPADAVKLYTRLNQDPHGEPALVRDMDGKPVDIEQLRRLTQ